MAKDIEETIKELEEQEEKTTVEPKKQRKKRSPNKSSKKKFSENEISKYFVLMFNFIAKVLDIDRIYTEEDFMLESEMMDSIAKKWDIVNKGLQFISPLVLLLSIAEKGYELYTLKQHKKFEGVVNGET